VLIAQNLLSIGQAAVSSWGILIATCGFMKSIKILLLSQSDIIQLDLSRDDVLGAVEQAMREHSADSYEMHPKIGVHPAGTDPDYFIHATPAYLKQLGACRLKWVGGFAKNPPHGLPIVTGI
jgi:ornithine cyclodeaminase/alanine dehydrogenase-like protein (mu-crystallin family)